MSRSGLTPGDVVDQKFRILDVIGAGGMGEILLAEHLELRIRVALKVPHVSQLTSTVAQERFLREARAAAALTNPHVCRIFDVARMHDGTSYLVMEFLRGTSLQGLLKERGPLPLETVVDYVMQACEGLAEAHALGIVHRDLKPANLFLTESTDRRPRIKVLDFGISRSYEESAPNGAPRLTQENSILGSPQFMSPEQLASPSDVDARSDIWSLGVTLHVLATGAFPYADPSFPSVCVAIASGEVQIHPRLPAELRPIVERCLQFEPRDRYAGVHELAAALDDLTGDSGTRVARIGRTIGAGVLDDETLAPPPVPASPPPSHANSSVITTPTPRTPSPPAEPATAAETPRALHVGIPTPSSEPAAPAMVEHLAARNAHQYFTPDTAFARAHQEGLPRPRWSARARTLGIAGIATAITVTVVLAAGRGTTSSASGAGEFFDDAPSAGAPAEGVPAPSRQPPAPSRSAGSDTNPIEAAVGPPTDRGSAAAPPAQDSARTAKPARTKSRPGRKQPAPTAKSPASVPPKRDEYDDR